MPKLFSTKKADVFIAESGTTVGLSIFSNEPGPYRNDHWSVTPDSRGGYHLIHTSTWGAGKDRREYKYAVSQMPWPWIEGYVNRGLINFPN